MQEADSFPVSSFVQRVDWKLAKAQQRRLQRCFPEATRQFSRYFQRTTTFLGEARAVKPMLKSSKWQSFSDHSLSLLRYDDVVERLAGLGCERVGDAGAQHGLWMLKGRCCFTVPEMGDGKNCPAEVLHEIVSFIEHSSRMS